MDHDSKPAEINGPASRRSADIRRAYLEFLEGGLAAFNEQIMTEAGYSSNADGHFAWDVSLYVRAASHAWRITENPRFLRYATYWSAHLCERTDLGLGVTDWRGRSRNVWSAGARYTAGTATVGMRDGVPIRMQAAADAIVIEKTSQTTARVRAIRDQVTVWAPPEGSLNPQSDAYLPDVLALNSSGHSMLFSNLEERMDLTAIESGTYVMEPQLAPHLVHTGLIARSLLAVAEALDEAGPGVVGSALTPRELFARAEAAIEAHEDELTHRGGHPWYVTPTDFPGRRLGMELPHNQVIDAATATMIIGRRRGAAETIERGVGMASRFLEEVAAYERGELEIPWNYYPADSDSFIGGEKPGPVGERVVRPVPRAEDSSHATMRARALVDWKIEGSLGLSDKLVRIVAESFRRSYVTSARGARTLRWLPGDPAGSPRQGTCDTYVGAWGALSPWAPKLERAINGIAYSSFPKAYYGATVLSAAEIVIMNT